MSLILRLFAFQTIVTFFINNKDVLLHILQICEKIYFLSCLILANYDFYALITILKSKMLKVQWVFKNNFQKSNKLILLIIFHNLVYCICLNI